MARTKAQDFDSKRDAIMKQAAILFASQGFNGTSISDLSIACGVSKSLIYHYYSAKEDILFEVMSTHIDELIAVVGAANLTTSTPKETFTNLTKALLACYVGAASEQKVLLYELNKLKPEQREDIIAKQRSIIETFETTYNSIYSDLKLNPTVLRSKVMLFFGMVNWTHTWFNPKGPISRDELAELAVDTML